MRKRPVELVGTLPVSDPDAFTGQLPRRHNIWVAVAAVLAVAGILGSFVAASLVARGDAEKSRNAFQTSSAEIASTLQLAIQREEDLIAHARAFILDAPDASNAQLSHWLDSVRAFERYPELQSLGKVVVVQASELPAFAARAEKDPAASLGPDGSFQVIPPGARPLYCFAAITRDRARTPPYPAGLDFCPSPASAKRVLTLQAAGQSSYVPISNPAVGTGLVVQVPIYRGGVVPTTVSARRSAFVGFVGLFLNPTLLLDRALMGHPSVAVSLRRSATVFSSGEAPEGAFLVVIDLHNGWTVETRGSVVSGSVGASRTAITLLIAGVSLSLLLAALIVVLATGRARALGLVRDRTGELRHQALHDALTGLPNRALITDRIEQLLARNRRQGTHGAALFIDLDEFKNVNDSLGHEAGDRLLVAVAARLTSTLRDADTIGRMGGDEFVVLIDGGAMQVAPELVAERLLDVMRQPFELDGASMPLIVNTSIGIAVGDRVNPGDLLRDADVALYEAKAAGKNRHAVFHPEMQTEILERIELEFDLRSALEGDQFRLAYQPIYNLDNLALVGVEALLRWEHPTLGLVQPDAFIPILEQTGQIREVGRWVLSEACEQMAAWHARGDTLDISINVSGRQLDDDAIVDHISEALAVSGLDASSLIIEVTETALMRHADATVARLQAIKDLGVRIAVDDFGTGYSSLAYLQQFPVDCLKIDRAFTNAITTSPESKALIGTLVQLGKDLGLTTLAEGVETPGQMDHLRGEDVNEVQGFLFSRPLDAETFERQLLEPTRREEQGSNRP